MVHCLERSTGKEIWTFATKARVESSPLITGNRVYVGSNDGVLYELDLLSGKKIWDFTAGAPLSASPASSQGLLVIGSQDGVLYCFGD
jgi:outer membrane protein assembly factor BamB